MIANIIKLIFNKELLLFNPHRNSEPLLNAENKKRFVFFDPVILWKMTRVFGKTTKGRDHAMYYLLSLVNPRAIIDINWITHLHSIYYFWAKKHSKKFIVVQHGTYVGGVVADAPHRYTKCQEFWVWSNFWKEMFQQNNMGKKVNYKVIGNPIYNQYNRSSFDYKQNLGIKILVACSLVTEEQLYELNQFIVKLQDLGFEVTVKEKWNQSLLSKPIQCERKIQGSFYEILHSQTYDIVVSDFSAALCDILFFKTRVIFFSAIDEIWPVKYENLYSQYLPNLAFHYTNLSCKEELFNFVAIEKQENLLMKMVMPGDNIIKIT